jgi:isoleucyl-tRNA synthetase
VVLGRSARNNAAIKNRQPIANIYIQGKPVNEPYVDIIKDELNIKDVQFTDDLSAFLTYSFKPQLRTLGPKYGKLVPKIGEALKNVDGSAFMAQIKQGTAELEIEGTIVSLAESDVLYEQAEKGGYFFVSDKGITVVIDAHLTPELIEEGFVREIISKVQNMRKEADFEVLDRIVISYQSSQIIRNVFTRHGDLIKAETLAEIITEGLTSDEMAAGYKREWNINGQQATFSLKRV